MTNLTPLRNFINEPHCDLGPNAWKLLDLVKTMRNKRMLEMSQTHTLKNGGNQKHPSHLESEKYSLK